jgi:hypothetical protein
LGQSTRSAASEWTAAFVQRLRELGWIEGRTIAIEYRWAEGREERFAEIAASSNGRGRRLHVASRLSSLMTLAFACCRKCGSRPVGPAPIPGPPHRGTRRSSPLTQPSLLGGLHHQFARV